MAQMKARSRTFRMVALLAILFVASAHEVALAFTEGPTCGETLDSDLVLTDLRWRICAYKAFTDDNPVRGALMLDVCDAKAASDYVESVVDYGWCMGAGGLLGWFKS